MVTRQIDVTIPAHEVQKGDLLFGIPVSTVKGSPGIASTHSLGGVIVILAYDPDTEAGITMHITSNTEVQVTRPVPVGPGECVNCGRPRKYENLCAACYQRRRRTARTLTFAPGVQEGFHRQLARERLQED